MPLADFHRSDPFTLGIELELQVVNPPGYDLSQDASTLIADVQHQLTVGEAKHDITESMLEIATGVCRDISHAQIQLSAIQQAVQRAALRHHLQICGGGSHPFHARQRQQISDNPRLCQNRRAFWLSGTAGDDLWPACARRLPERRRRHLSAAWPVALCTALHRP